jgi:hypothetical protein
LSTTVYQVNAWNRTNTNGTTIVEVKVEREFPRKVLSSLDNAAIDGGSGVSGETDECHTIRVMGVRIYFACDVVSVDGKDEVLILEDAVQ